MTGTAYHNYPPMPPGPARASTGFYPSQQAVRRTLRGNGSLRAAAIIAVVIGFVAAAAGLIAALHLCTLHYIDPFTGGELLGAGDAPFLVRYPYFITGLCVGLGALFAGVLHILLGVWALAWSADRRG